MIIFLVIFFALAAFLHGLSGLGFPMVITAVLSLSMPLKEAVIWALFPTLFVNLMSIFWGANILSSIKKFWLLTVSAFVGSLAGVKILLLVHQQVLQLLLSAVILLYVAFNFYKEFYKKFFKREEKPSKNDRPPLPKNEKPFAAVFRFIFFGFLAGAIGGATNAMSPILMMFLLSYSTNQNEITVAANLSFLVGKLAQLFGLYPVIHFTNNEVYLVMALTMLSLFFLYFGTKIRKFVSVKTFRFIVLLFLTVISFVMLSKIDFAV